MEHLDIRIRGIVQGVNFRWETKKTSDKLGLTGLVRNEPDGSVHIEAEGDSLRLEKLVEWCNHGPWFAKVHEVVVEKKELKGYDEFIIQS